MKIEIDTNAGFCFGVVRATRKAEAELEHEKELYCLGDIVHNNMEMARMQEKGLVTITHDEFKKLKNCKVLIRAHGEPPETYWIAKKNNIELIDASCPVVLQLQKKVRDGFEQMIQFEGQIVIYGKKGHAEVNGLIGHADSNAIVVEDFEDIDKIDYRKPMKIYSQTTMSQDKYFELVEMIKDRYSTLNKNPDDNVFMVVNNTICKQVSSREPNLKEFARKHDVIIFVSGPKSSNGKMLYNVCKKENSRSYFISDVKEIKHEWLSGTGSVGISGATSTPKWLMEEVADYLNSIQ